MNRTEKELKDMLTIFDLKIKNMEAELEYMKKRREDLVTYMENGNEPSGGHNPVRMWIRNVDEKINAILEKLVSVDQH